MSDENKRIVEIDGVKLEVDLRNAKVIDHYKVGDPVRVLSNDSSERIHPGVIVGFCEFDKSPAIEIMILENNYRSIEFSIITLVHGKSNKYQIAPLDKYQGLLSQTNIITQFDREIQKKELELADMKLKKEYFIKDFAKAFERIVPIKGVLD